jgi:hypothetical protein
MNESSPAKVAMAAGAALVLALVAVGFAVWSGPEEPAVAIQAPAEIDGPRLMLIRERHLAFAALADPGGSLQVSPVECVRAYAAGGTTVCLHQDSPWAYSLQTLDATLHRTRSFPIEGLPNRARVSPGGRLVAWTSFTGGDSYNGGQFSTRTGILDTSTGQRVDSLESFSVLRDGRPYRNVDVNFWGVTFAADENRFYATMATAGRRYLVEGDFAARQVRTITENVECPSLSPDGTRLAFKQAIDANPDNGWRLSVLDLASLKVTALAETRSIDDQAAWISDTAVAYTVRDSSGDPTVWSTPADGGGTPAVLRRSAESPTGPVD